ncbi:hypothetical protein L0337_09850 [candidate division KSB1 bacterium]|nr:hypothetical protein [candidate division KSB1 bacterium]
MFISYDSEGDLLEVIFDESLHQAEQMAYELRDGILIYVSVPSHKLVQLTLVSYRALAQIPVVQFEGWKKLTAAAKKKLLPILTSSPVVNFLRLDPKTGRGHVTYPATPEIFAIAA